MSKTVGGGYFPTKLKGLGNRENRLCVQRESRLQSNIVEQWCSQWECVESELTEVQTNFLQGQNHLTWWM